MSTEALTLNIPPSLAQELKLVNEEFLILALERGLQVLRVERALAEYARGGISFGAAAHQAGISQSELARHAYSLGMDPPFSLATLAEELS
ncbi:MAG TPA: hypothetical protein VJ302_26310 [Blastocatellia bacterium]|nr:hypothetical protein [Blastocatellia bacterium]